MNKRRELLIALGAGALVAPLGSFAQQQGKVWRVGFLSSESNTRFGNGNRVAAFRAGLRDLGYEEGRNLVIEFRWADGNYEQLPELASETLESEEYLPDRGEIVQRFWIEIGLVDAVIQ